VANWVFDTLAYSEETSDSMCLASLVLVLLNELKLESELSCLFWLEFNEDDGSVKEDVANDDEITEEDEEDIIRRWFSFLRYFLFEYFLLLLFLLSSVLSVR